MYSSSNLLRRKKDKVVPFCITPKQTCGDFFKITIIFPNGVQYIPTDFEQANILELEEWTNRNQESSKLTNRKKRPQRNCL
jgi:hypothetical protein